MAFTKHKIPRKREQHGVTVSVSSYLGSASMLIVPTGGFLVPLDGDCKCLMPMKHNNI